MEILKLNDINYSLKSITTLPLKFLYETALINEGEYVANTFLNLRNSSKLYINENKDLIRTIHKGMQWEDRKIIYSTELGNIEKIPRILDDVLSDFEYAKFMKNMQNPILNIDASLQSIEYAQKLIQEKELQDKIHLTKKRSFTLN